MNGRTRGRTSDEVPFLADEEKDSLDLSQSPSRRDRWAKWFILSSVLNITALIPIFANWRLLGLGPKKAYIPNEIYSPAQSVVEYETVRFTGGLKGDPSPYMGSSGEVDAKWEELYGKAAVSQIDAAMAAKLPNATTPFNEDPSHYIVTLDVFHQLHCLNMMRKLVYPDIYPKDLTSGSAESRDNVVHFEHCYEQLRQSLQCHSDVSTIFWEWSERRKRYLGNAHTTHTCRNFEKIRQWGNENRARTDLDFYTKVEGAPIYQEAD
ncbi:hypothetical protein LEL_06455 [Akanthomyces lecanii RCEF 1005]|uniref:Tat pathway signal sequence n=1 Tax=Akanthomyces lecanii RCEF 1005 TaxID=1081108 RepID=A0A168GQ75_CORDF|nr:hypothetical protein LEL_06455 [Akanthomyces lecanii RCEF 1005]